MFRCESRRASSHRDSPYPVPGLFPLNDPPNQLRFDWSDPLGAGGSGDMEVVDLTSGDGLDAVSVDGDDEEDSDEDDDDEGSGGADDDDQGSDGDDSGGDGSDDDYDSDGDGEESYDGDDGNPYGASTATAAAPWRSGQQVTSNARCRAHVLPCVFVP